MWNREDVKQEKEFEFKAGGKGRTGVVRLRSERCISECYLQGCSFTCICGKDKRVDVVINLLLSNC